jgi:hypothetical protein
MRFHPGAGPLAMCSFLILLVLPVHPALATAQSPERPPARSGPGGPNDVAYAPAGGDDPRGRVPLDTAALRHAIGEKSSRVSPQTRANAERRLQEATHRVDLIAQDAGDAMLAGRLAREFRAPAAALTRERSELGATWGELLIAYTLAVNTRSRVEASQLVRWRHGGMHWSQLASGLGLSLNSVVSSVDAEARVATGLSHADGRVAAIYGEGARGPGPGLDTGVGSR